jgi:hypothetical protein
MPRTFRQRHEPRHDVRIWFGQLASSLVLAIHVAGLGLVASCAETPLGPSISGRDYSTDVDTDASGGVTSGDQPDDDAAGSDDDLVPVDTDTDTDTDTATDTDTDTDVAVGLACAETSTQNVWYPGANVLQTVTCNNSVTSMGAPTVALPGWLSLATALPATVLNFTGTAGAAATTNWNATYEGEASDTLVVQTRVLGTTPTYLADATVALTDNVAASVDVSAVLDAAYDGSGGELKPLMSNTASPATTSNGTVVWAASDIPQLTYTDGNCAVATAPYVCADTGATSATTATSTYEIKWNWGIFDQGSYEINTKAYLDVDGANVYSTTSSATTFSVPDLGGEQTVLTSARIGHSDFFADMAISFGYVPALAMNDALSTIDSEVFGVVYAANNGTRNQWGGIVTVDRDIDAANLDSGDWFDPEDFNDPSKFSDDNIFTMAVAAASGVDEWIALVGNDGVSGRNLILTVMDHGGGVTTKTRIPVTNLADGSIFDSVAITEPFNDGGSMRHGIAFYAHWNPGGDNTQHLYVSKISSNPQADTPVGANDVPGFFNAGAWYDTTANDLAGTVESVPVTTVDQNSVLSLVKIVNGVVGATKYFYVGWRNESTLNLSFARVEASSAGVPEVIQTNGGDVITKMDGVSTSALGRPDYAIASGTDEDGGDILGVVYAQDDSGTHSCVFQAYEFSGTELVHKGTARPLGATITDCRFPNLWFNAGTGQFMAMLVNGTNGDTNFYSFAYDSDGDALVPPIPAPTRITDRAAPPCMFAATYSSVWSRIGTVSVEGDCAGGAHNMKFDLYKPAR